VICQEQRPENFLIDLVADVRFAFQRDHVSKASALRDGDGRVFRFGSWLFSNSGRRRFWLTCRLRQISGFCHAIRLPR
jgi:hypothetical protein